MNPNVIEPDEPPDGIYDCPQAPAEHFGHAVTRGSYTCLMCHQRIIGSWRNFPYTTRHHIEEDP